MAKSFIRFSFDDSDRESALNDPAKNLSLAINIQEFDDESQHFVQKRPTDRSRSYKILIYVELTIVVFALQ